MPGIGSSLPPPNKKQKVSKSSKKAESSKNASQKVAELEKLISEALSGNASLNPLADLLQIASSAEDDAATVKAIFALYRSFTLIFQKGILNRLDKGVDEGAKSGRKAVRTWVTARLDAFTELLCELLQDEDKTIRVRDLLIDVFGKCLTAFSSDVCPPDSLLSSTSAFKQHPGGGDFSTLEI